MKNTLPGALLSVLLLAGMTLLALPAAAQNLHHGKHESPDGSTACDHNSNCATNDGITVNGNLGGVPSNANPLAPGSGSGWGDLGMGAPAGGYGPGEYRGAPYSNEDDDRRQVAEPGEPCTQWYRDGFAPPCSDGVDGDTLPGILDTGCAIFQNGDTHTNIGTAAMAVGGILSGNVPLAAAGGAGWATNRIVVNSCKLLGLGIW